MRICARWPSALSLPPSASSLAILKVFQWLTYWTYRPHQGSVGKLSRKVREAISSHDHRELCLKRTEYSWGWGRALCKPTRSLWARPACRCWSVASAPPPLNCQQNQPLSPLSQINTKSQHDFFFLISGFTLLFGKKVKTVLQNYMSISRSLWIHDYQHWNVTWGFSMELSTHIRKTKYVFRGKKDVETSCFLLKHEI